MTNTKILILNMTEARNELAAWYRDMLGAMDDGDVRTKLKELNVLEKRALEHHVTHVYVDKGYGDEAVLCYSLPEAPALPVIHRETIDTLDTIDVVDEVVIEPQWVGGDGGCWELKNGMRITNRPNRVRLGGVIYTFRYEEDTNTGGDYPHRWYYER